MTEQQELFAYQMQTLFRVWKGTENAEDILTDVARTIGHRFFGLTHNNNALNQFADFCAERYDDD